jgi:tripartite ATP-independent transporter DctP family solute receptor
MKKHLSFAVLAFLMVFFYLPGQSDAQTLRFGHHHAVGGHVDQTVNLLEKLVREKTDGKLTIKVFPGGQLAQEREAFEQLHQGMLDMTITTVGLMDRYWPPLGVDTLPFVWRDWDHAEKALKGKWSEAIAGGIDKHTNAKLLAIVGLGFRHMLFRGEPVTKADNMKGMKMRSPESYVWIRMFELLGAKPTPVTWGEVYSAMQTGLAEGLESPALMVLDMKFNEVTKSLVKTNHMFGSMVISINKKSFDRLSPDLQKAVQEATREAAQWSFQYGKTGETGAFKTLTEKGMKVVEPENIQEWAGKVKPLWEEIATKRPGSAELIKILTETK